MGAIGPLQWLRGGIPIVFLGGAREIVELLDYEEKTYIDPKTNSQIRRVRLFLQWSEKFQDRQTGFWFDPETDFDPPLPGKFSDGRIPWEDLGGTVIVCFKSFDGQRQWKDGVILSYQERLRVLTDYLMAVKRNAIVVLQQLEQLKNPEAKTEEVFYLAEQLAALDEMIRKVPTGNSKMPLGGDDFSFLNN